MAGVTAVLKNLTQNWFANPALTATLGATPTVSALPPDLAEDVHSDGPGVNWFMHRTARNPGLAGAFNPARNSNGDRIQRAPLPIDLYYLLSAYGSSDLHAEIVLGYALQLFHENPILNQAAISAALATAAPGDAAIITALNNARIADHLHQIRLALHHPDDEWLSKLWGALNARYRPSVVFHVSVILIESELSFQPGLPVQGYTVEPVPLTLPRLIRVDPAGQPGGQVPFGADLILRGSNLSHDTVRVQIGSLTLTDSELGDITRTEIHVPAAAIAGLRAGVNSAQVLHDIDLGVPPVAHRGFQSNVIPFILHPVISNITPALGAGPDGLLAGTIQVDVQPAVARGQRVTLLLTGTGAAAAFGYSFTLPPRDSDTPLTTVTINVAGIEPGDYHIRLQVDGAASLLTVNPATGTYNQPPVTLS